MLFTAMTSDNDFEDEVEALIEKQRQTSDSHSSSNSKGEVGRQPCPSSRSMGSAHSVDSARSEVDSQPLTERSTYEGRAPLRD